MPDQPRRHHYVPKFYLAGFTKYGTVDGELYVLDQRQRKQWKSTPLKTAHQRDFHAIEARPGADPMVVEKSFADIEGKCSRVVANVIEQGKLPTGEDHDILLNFVAMMAVRVPGIRNIISRAVDDLGKNLLCTALGSDQGWQEFKQDLNELYGHRPPPMSTGGRSSRQRAPGRRRFA